MYYDVHNYRYTSHHIVLYVRTVPWKTASFYKIHIRNMKRVTFLTERRCRYTHIQAITDDAKRRQWERHTANFCDIQLLIAWIFCVAGSLTFCSNAASLRIHKWYKTASIVRISITAWTFKTFIHSFTYLTYNRTRTTYCSKMNFFKQASEDTKSIKPENT